jgi:hypothetical protein
METEYLFVWCRMLLCRKKTWQLQGMQAGLCFSNFEPILYGQAHTGSARFGLLLFPYWSQQEGNWRFLLLCKISPPACPKRRVGSKQHQSDQAHMARVAYEEEFDCKWRWFSHMICCASTHYRWNYDLQIST